MPTRPATAPLIDDSSLVGTALSRAWTEEIDRWLAAIVDTVDGGDARGTGDAARFALAAEGGYGRGELSPKSDLDLLLLHDGTTDIAATAERIWYPIWDAGFKVGHAVRTPAEALDLAAGDLDTATSLLDIRHLGGDPALVAELADAAEAQWRSRSEKVLASMVKRTVERHAANGEVAFLLEPDLKLARGGLRDVHTLRWMDRADPTLLLPTERSGLAGPHDTVLAARVELHRRTGRTGDVLLLQEQDEVAAALGYGDADELMAALAAAARSVAWIEDAVLHRIHLRSQRRRLRRPKTVGHGHGIEVVDRTLRLTDDAPVVTDPVLPLRVALVAAREESFIERDVLDRMADETPPLPDPWPDDARQVFVDLLLVGHKSIRVLEALDQVELITRILPEWAPNRSRPQRNAYHRFTVDRHLFETAAEAAELVSRVSRPDLLVLGALFHDIGKGYPGDHSVVGVELVRRIGTRMGFTAPDVEVLAALVRHHLLLPDTASRRDLDDEGTIRFVAEEIGSTSTIALLDALTEADSIATGPSAWNNWKAGLVHELAARAIAYLEGDHVGPVDSVFPSAEHLDLVAAGEQVVRIDGHELLIVAADRPSLFCRVAGALALHGVEILEASVATEGSTAIQVLRLGGGLGLDERPETVTEAVELALRGRLALRARLLERARTYRYQRVTTARPVSPQVVVDNEASTEATVLEVRGPDSIGLLYRITRAMVELDLDIVRAKVQTLGDDVVDAFYVRARDGESGGKVLDPEYLAEIEIAVLSAIAADA